MTMLVSTAYMDEAERFDRLIAMDAGKILTTGTPDEVQKNTKTDNLEMAFVALLPVEKQGEKKERKFQPRIETHGDAAIVAEGLTQRFGDFTAVKV